MKEERIKETVTKAKPDIFFPCTLPRNEGDAVRIKTLSWKPEFSCRKMLYTSSKKRESTHIRPREWHAPTIFLN